MEKIFCSNRIITKSDLRIVFLLVFLNLCSSISGANFLLLFFQFFLVYRFFINKQYVYLALLFFNFSTYGSGISIYSFKLIYIICLIIIIVNKDYNNIISQIPNKTTLYFGISVFSLFIAYSSYNIYFSYKHFLGDIIILYGVFCGFCIFNRFSKSELIKLSILLFLNILILRTIQILTGFGVLREADSLGRVQTLIGPSETISIFVYFSIYILFFERKISMKMKLLFLFLWVFLAVKLKAFSSMPILFEFCCFVFLIILKNKYSKKFRKYFLIIGIPIIATLVIIFLSFFNIFGDSGDSNNPLTYKLQNIFMLIKYIDFSDKNKIFMIPLSPRVRLLEIINTLKTGNPIGNLIGRGIGGHFRDDYINFENPQYYAFIGPWDFSDEERLSHNFYTAHNWGYPLLKYGLLFFIIAFFLFIQRNKISKKNKDHFGSFLAFATFLSAISYLGFTFQTSMVIGILLATLKNYFNNIELNKK